MHIVEYARGYEVLYIERPDHWFLLLFMYIIRFFLSHRRVHVCNNREKKIFFKDSNFNSSICNISTCNSCCRTLLLRTDIITSLDYVREELTNQSYSCFPVVNWEDCVDYVNFCIILAPYYF